MTERPRNVGEQKQEAAQDSAARPTTIRDNVISDADVARVSNRAEKADIADVLMYLREVVGQGLVALVAGETDPRVVGLWIRQRQSPSDGSFERLRDAYVVVALLREHVTTQTVQSWITGTNPFLDHRAPALVLRDGEDRGQVLEAARQLLAVD